MKSKYRIGSVHDRVFVVVDPEERETTASDIIFQVTLREFVDGERDPDKDPTRGMICYMSPVAYTNRPAAKRAALARIRAWSVLWDGNDAVDKARES